MKKTFFMVLLVVGWLSISAQYKEASFFSRNGKFVGPHTGATLFGEGISAAPSIGFVWGRDKIKNRIWHWFEVNYVTASKFKYTTKDRNNQATAVNVSGKVKGFAEFRYNWAYNLVGKDHRDTKSRVFAKISIGSVLGIREAKEGRIITPANANPVDVVGLAAWTGSFDLGLGYKYRMSEKIELFGAAGYRYTTAGGEITGGTFNPIPSSTFFNFGIFFSRQKENDEE